MKKNSYILLMLVFSLFSCKREEELPKGILDEKDMITLMVDMEIAQATLKYEAASEGKPPNYTKAFKMVCDSNNITLEELDKNLTYYCAEPIKMRQVYDEVIVKLSEQQAKLSKKQLSN